MFTFSFGSAFAATTYTSADYQQELWTNQWQADGAYSDRLAVAERAYETKLGLSGDRELYGSGVKASDLGLKAGNANWTDAAFTGLKEVIRENAETAVTTYISQKIELEFGETATSTTTAPTTYDIGAASLYETTLSFIAQDADNYTTAVNAEINKFSELQADSIYTAVTAKINGISESAYSADNANKIAVLKTEYRKAVQTIYNDTAADLIKAENMVKGYAEFKKKADKIPTLEDEDYDDTNAAASIADAVADYVSFGLTSAYGGKKLVADQAVPKHLLVASNENIYEKISGNRAKIFGVEVADVTDVTKAEATAVNKAFYNAILESADVVTAYANAIDVDTVAERVAAVKALSGDNSVAEFLASLDATIEAVNVYENVVTLGEEYKDTYSYGVKVYDDAKVDQAVEEAEDLVYADLKAGFDTPANYIAEAAKEGGYSIYAENFEYDSFMNAIGDAVAKFFKVNGDPQVKVLYGENKTPEEDYVYLKATYASREGVAWTAIANDAVEAIRIAESYDDINAALETAAADMSELMKAEDEVAVTAAIEKYKKALKDDQAAAEDVMGLKDYSQKAYDDAYANGCDLIDDADTLEEAAAYYADAVAMFKAIPTKEELAAAQKSVIDQIAALPTTSSLTANDKDAVVAVLNAYMDYDAMPGSNTLGVSNTYTLNADLDTVLRLVGKDIQDRVDAMVKELAKYNANTDNGATALLAKEADIVALIAEGEEFNDLLDDVATVDSLDVDIVADVTKLSTLESYLYAENDCWRSDLQLVLAAANTASTSAEKVAVVEAYDQLTDRQKYKLEQNIKTLIESFKAEIISSVESIKITASSSAAKGSMTIKWRVSGDTSGVEAFEIWRSTKKSSGFQKFFTTTDGTKRTYKNTKSLKAGTRYYYKVRGIAYVDGVKIYSDWSNKAYRIAK